MQRFYRVVLILLSIITGATFLYSAYTKLFPIQSFEYTMIEYIQIPARLAAILARFFTGLEAALGALIIFHFYGKGKWVLKTAFLLLIAFSIYLIWLWIVAGNDVNCGCFGDAIWMSPATSLAKNAGLLLITWLLIRYHFGFNFVWARFIAPSILISSITAVFIFFPVFSRYRIDLIPLYTSDHNFSPEINLDSGKHILAFLSPSCIHCRRAGLKMHQMAAHNPKLPFYLVIGGTTSDIKDFWKESQAMDLSHTRLPIDPFMKYTKGSFPTILWINNGIVEADMASYKDLDEVVIEKWLKAKNVHD